MIKYIPSLNSTLNNIDCKLLVPTDSYLTQTLLSVLPRLVQKQTRLFLTQSLTIFYPLKDWKSLCFKKSQFFTNSFVAILQSLLRIFLVLLYLSCFFLFNILFSIFFCTPRHPRFSLPSGCDILVYYAILYINIVQ